MNSMSCLSCHKSLLKTRKPFENSVKFCKTINKSTKEKTETNKYSKTVLLPKSSYPLRHSRALELDPNNVIIF